MDLEKARHEIRHWHEEFVRQFHKDDHERMNQVFLKYDHTQRVVIEMRGMIEALGVTPELAVMAEISALLHDIGRYQQYITAESFDDTAIDHAEISAKLIEDEKVLRLLPPSLAEGILQVIRYHNKDTHETSLREDVTQVIAMIRDIDKLDIWRLVSVYYMTPVAKRELIPWLELPEEGILSDTIRETFRAGKVSTSQKIENLTDLKFQQLSWLYGITYDWTAQVAQHRRYLGKIIDTLPINNEELYLLASPALHQLEQRALQAKEAGFRGR